MTLGLKERVDYVTRSLREEGSGRRESWLYKGSTRHSCGDGNFLCLDCINVSTLVVITFYSPLRCYHWENWVKRTWDQSALS